jgi:hypothetical protein
MLKRDTSNTMIGDAIIGVGLLVGGVGLILGIVSITWTTAGGEGVVLIVASVFQMMLFVAIGGVIGDLRSAAVTNSRLVQLMMTSIEQQQVSNSNTKQMVVQSLVRHRKARMRDWALRAPSPIRVRPG